MWVGYFDKNFKRSSVSFLKSCLSRYVVVYQLTTIATNTCFLQYRTEGKVASICLLNNMHMPPPPHSGLSINESSIQMAETVGVLSTQTEFALT